jgi:sensor histidine kinase regulating citrate/malate metabolism
MKRWIETASIHWKLAKAHPQNVLLALFILVMLLVSGISIASVFSKSEHDQLQEEALSLAEETGLFF